MADNYLDELDSILSGGKESAPAVAAPQAEPAGYLDELDNLGAISPTVAPVIQARQRDIAPTYDTPLVDAITSNPVLDTMVGIGELTYKGFMSTVGLATGVVAGTTAAVTQLFDPIESNTGTAPTGAGLFTQGIESEQKTYDYKPVTNLARSVDYGVKEGVSKPLQQSATAAGRRAEAYGGPVAGAAGETLVQGTAAILGIYAGLPKGRGAALPSKTTSTKADREVIIQGSQDTKVSESLKNVEEVGHSDPLKYDSAGLQQALSINKEFQTLITDKYVNESSPQVRQGMETELAILHDAEVKLRGQIAKNTLDEMEAALGLSPVLNPSNVKPPIPELPTASGATFSDVQKELFTVETRVNGNGDSIAIPIMKKEDVPIFKVQDLAGRLGSKSTVYGSEAKEQFRTFANAEAINTFVGNYAKTNSPDQIDFATARAVEDFQGGTYKEINGYLRKIRELDGFKLEQVTGHIASLDKLLTRTALQENITVFRGIKSTKQLLGAGISKNLVGREFSDPGFVSTSLDREFVKAFVGVEDGATLKIQVPAGTPSTHLSTFNPSRGFSEENEIVLGRGLRFTVTDVDPTTNLITVRVGNANKAGTRPPTGASPLRQTITDIAGEAAKYWKPPAFIAESHPVVAYGVEKLSAHDKHTKSVTEHILQATQFAPGKGGILSKTKQVATEQGAITPYTKLSSQAQQGLLEATFSLARDRGAMSDNVSLNKLESLGMDHNQIAAYKGLVEGRDKAIYFANQMITAYAPDGTHFISPPSTFIPHTFQGKFRVIAKGEDGKVSYLPATSLKAATDIAASLKKDGLVSSARAEPRRGETYDEPTRLFSETQLFEKSPQAVKDWYMRNIEKSGVYEGMRQGVTGREMGRNTTTFAKSYSAWVEGAVKYGQSFRIKKELGYLYNDPHIQNAYPNAIHVVKNYHDAMMGRKGVTSKFVDDLVSRYIGENKISEVVGVGNKLLSTLYLFAGNVKFLAQQVVQPYHMAPAAMYKAAAQLNLPPGNALKSVAQAHRAMLRPSKEEVEAIRYSVKNGTIEPKFVNTLMGDNFFEQGITTKAELWRNRLTGRGLASAAEVWGRTLENLTFYRFLRNSGMKHEEAVTRSATMTDLAMVQYKNVERPVLISEQGVLGPMGRMVGAFKSFTFNYFAQLASYVKLAKDDHSYKPLAAFLSTQALVAGASGLILVKEADFILEQLGYPSLSETLMTSGMPDAVVYGAPTASTDMDFAGGMKAPSVLPKELLSVPVLDYSAEVSSSVYNYAKKWWAGTVTPTDAMRLELAVAPKSFHAAIEYAHTKGGDTPVPDPKRSGIGKVQRDFHDWAAAFMSTKSLNERKILNSAWAIQKMKARDRLSKDSLITYAAWMVNNKLDIPQWVYDRALDPKEALFSSPKAFTNAIINRTEAMNNTVIDRIKKYGHTPQGRKALKVLEETGVDTYD